MWNPGAANEDGETDEALMLAYAAGDTRAFERLYERHKGPTYRYLLRHLGSQARAAEELHQDLWLKVVAARDRYAPTARFATWLYTLARHRLVDHWRASGRGAALSLDEDRTADEAEVALAGRGDDDGPLLHAAIDAQAGRRLVAALADVPPPQRDAFLLHVEGGLSLAEIAAATSASQETVKSRLRYAYRRLRRALEDLR